MASVLLQELFFVEGLDKFVVIVIKYTIARLGFWAYYLER